MVTIRSNSETSSFLTCETKHLYSYRKRLAPKRHAKALTRGIVGHEALENYYYKRLEGASIERCLNAATDIVDAALIEMPEFDKEFGQLLDILPKYAAHYWDEPFKVLAVEPQYETQFPGCADWYGFRLDLLVEGTSGKYKGQVGIIDHKFLYDPFTERDIQNMPQMLKYAAALRNNGIDAKFALLSQIRYRQLKDYVPEKVFVRTEVPLKKAKMDMIVREHVKVSNKITALSQLTEAEHLNEATMTIDKGTCGMCAFNPICDLRLNGHPTALTIRSLYKNNSYTNGYHEAGEKIETPDPGKS